MCLDDVYLEPDCGEQGGETSPHTNEPEFPEDDSPNTTLPGTPEVPMDRADDFPKLVLASLASTYGDEEPIMQENQNADAPKLSASTSTASQKNDPRSCNFLMFL